MANSLIELLPLPILEDIYDLNHFELQDLFGNIQRTL